MSYQLGVNVWVDDECTIDVSLGQGEGWITVNQESSDVTLFVPAKWEEGGEQMVELRDALSAAIGRIPDRPDE